LQDYAVLLEFEPTIRPFGRLSLGILVYTLGGRRIAIHEHATQMDKTLDVIFLTRCQEVLEPLYHGVCTTQSTIHDVCTSPQGPLNLVADEEIHRRQIDAQASKTPGIATAMDEGEDFVLGLGEQALHQCRPDKSRSPYNSNTPHEATC
jgi:hypothetical protein